MYVLSPVSTFASEDYQAEGMKAEKKKCLSSEVWDGLEPGTRCGCFLMTKAGSLKRRWRNNQRGQPGMSGDVPWLRY